MSKSSRRGLLIVFEGMDRSGKTTQVKLAEEWLGEKCRIFQFPSRRNCTGRLISDILLKKEQNPRNPHFMHLLFSANRWEESRRISACVEEGLVVVVDRYKYSGFAYTHAQDPSIPSEWLWKCDEGLPEPDCVILLDCDAKAIAADDKREYGKELYEEIELQEKVRAAYRQMAVERGFYVINVDNKSPSDVHERVKNFINKHFEL